MNTCTNCKQEVATNPFVYLSHTKVGGVERWVLCPACLAKAFLTLVNGSDDRHRLFVNMMRNAANRK